MFSGEGWGMLPGTSAVVFVDNHDNQRGHGAGGPDIITHKDSKLYKVFNVLFCSLVYVK